jgi:hypothetical protein
MLEQLFLENDKLLDRELHLARGGGDYRSAVFACRCPPSLDSGRRGVPGVTLADTAMWLVAV